jgi:hypothetical protein
MKDWVVATIAAMALFSTLLWCISVLIWTFTD